MKILHITPSSKGYEEVTLLANRVSRKNHMSMIEKNGEKFFTGGLLINDTPKNRAVLDAIPTENQYEFVRSFKCDPFEKSYYDE